MWYSETNNSIQVNFNQTPSKQDDNGSKKHKRIRNRTKCVAFEKNSQTYGYR